MINIIKIIIIACIVSISVCGCSSTSSEEKAIAKEYKQKYEKDIKEYIKSYYGGDVKIKKISGDYDTKQDSLWFSSANYANGNVNVLAECNDETFDIRYYSDTNIYKTNKNEKQIEGSLVKYIIDAIGKDNILNLKFKYGSDPEYYDGSNLVNSEIESFEQVYNRENIVFIECFLRETDLESLKNDNSFSYLEQIIKEGSNEFGHMGAMFINIDDYENLSEDELKSMYNYASYSPGMRSVIINDITYYEVPKCQYYSSERHELVDYSIEHPNNTYCIKKDTDQLITLVY